MSKIIRFTAEMLDQAKLELLEGLSKARMVNGTISFSKTFTTGNAKAVLRFTELAWLKMKALVAENDKEVAWHGVADRLGDNVYVISDILVYPQEVTGATVDMDTDGYAKWIQNGIVSGDERFDHFHAQGHSHVNMSVSPSPTDLEHQKEILDMVRDTGFYIFMIWNKKNDHNIWIYDLGQNILFENSDVSVEIDAEPNGVVKFLEEAENMVKSRVPVAPVTKYGSQYQYGSQYYSGAKTEKPVGSLVASAAEKSAKDQKKKVTAHVERPQSSSMYDDDDDPSGPFYYNDRYSGSYWGC